MTYKYNPKTTKNRFLFYGIAILATGGGLATFLFLDTFAAVICTALGLWVSVTVLKAVAKVQSTKIVTHDEGFAAYLSNGTKLDFGWGDITHSGIVVNGEHKDLVFAYAEETDKIVKLPPIFFDFEDFKAELKEKTPYKEYTLEEGETIIDYLKKIVCPQTEEIPETEEDSKTE